MMKLSVARAMIAQERIPAFMVDLNVELHEALSRPVDRTTREVITEGTRDLVQKHFGDLLKAEETDFLREMLRSVTSVSPSPVIRSIFEDPKETKP